MIELQDKTQCCGCTACKSICAHNAITMKADGMGFMYPEVNAEKCTNCGLCERVCAFHRNYDKSHLTTNQSLYAARLKDISDVEHSQSGGAFAALGRWMIAQGGVVYGAGYAEHYRVVHKRAETTEELEGLRGSKYVQSSMEDVFLQVKDDLRAGRKVLFSGTACQTAGLQSFINKKDRENLLLVDIVCHGVPSPAIAYDYIAHLENKHKCRISHFNFRDKSEKGWDNPFESYIVKGKKYHSRHFTRIYFSCICLRPSCSACPFTNFLRPSDITIADFWDRHHRYPELTADNKGISTIICNTDRGLQIYNEIEPQLVSHAISHDDAWQHNLEHPTTPHLQSAQFENDYLSKGFIYVMKKYGDMGWKARSKDKAIELAVKAKHALGFKPSKR